MIKLYLKLAFVVCVSLLIFSCKKVTKKTYVTPFIEDLLCDSIYNSGKIIDTSYNQEYYINIPYLGGNGSDYDIKEFNSYSITGLKAVLDKGKLNIGNGILKIRITGKPNNTGYARFYFNFLNKSCELKIDVYASKENTKIGSYFEGGVVGYITEVNKEKHGLIVDLGSTEYPFNGIRQKEGWRLPTINELSQLYINKSEINKKFKELNNYSLGFYDKNYWSSEHDNVIALTLNFANGVSSWSFRYNLNYVKLVKSF